MKQFWTFCCIWTLMLLSGCDSQPIPSYTPQITGSIVSREAIAESPLTNGSPALFNATGGTTISNQVFTLNNGVWQNEAGKEVSINTESETTLTAIYPAFSGEVLVIDNPYTADTLQDVLIAQNTFTGTTDIQLKFQHLFSQLNVHVHSPIASSIEAIEVTAPKITKINPLNGTFTHEGTHTTRKTKDDSNVYSFIVPSIDHCPLTLTFIKDSEEEEVIYPLTHNFEAGHKYECHVNRPGIRNAADLIAFSKFINEPSNKGKIHTRFGEQIGEEVVYRLLDDIVLTEEDCKKLAPIGDHPSTPFYDIFDGQGHTISNLILPDENTLLLYSGLFGHIENPGIVKNLHITHATSIKSPTCKYVGVIAAHNGGIIDNCSVQNSRINSFSGFYIGLICGTATGKIINCYTINDTIDVSKDSRAGSIAGNSSGYITNCYTYKNTFNMSTGSYAGCILGTSEKAKIENCYVYHSKTLDKWGAAIGYSFNATIKNFYYNRGTLASNTNYKDSNVGRYDSDFLFEGTHICDLLNQWIGEKEGYTHWKTDATLPAVFDK